MKTKSIKFLYVALIFLGIVLIVTAGYLKNIYGGADFEQILYNVIYSEGTSMAPIWEGIKYCFFKIIILFLFFAVPFFFRKKIVLKVKLHNQKNFIINFFPNGIYAILISLVMIFQALNSIGFYNYMYNLKQETNIYDEYYVNPEDVRITFPKNKRNLLYIYIESMESSFADYTVDNSKKINTITNLTKLANENINFAADSSFGGFVQVSGTNYTVASMLAQTSGIPLKTGGNINTYGQNGNFLPGIVSLGDILEEQGYNQYLLIGSNASFAGRDKYFTEHGHYNIYDYDWAKREGHIDEDYNVWWGYEDKKLFQFAKEQLKMISNNSEPFNFTILTADTHASDGYLDKSCSKKYDDVYANVLICSDYMLGEFVEWFVKQEFSKNTTVVLAGDHLTMRLEVEELVSNNRFVYNTFINSATQLPATTIRNFTAFDMFPTTLASLGATIEENRLGLGTNLFSDEPSLIEILGLYYLDNELQKNSTFYNTKFLKNSYLETLNQNND